MKKKSKKKSVRKKSRSYNPYLLVLVGAVIATVVVLLMTGYINQSKLRLGEVDIPNSDSVNAQ